jgi:hypoxanthine phosphoribosyltransferase
LKLRKKDKFDEFISSARIQKKVKELAKRLKKDYRDKNPICIGILNGSFIFMADLVREIGSELEIDFLKLSSYDDSKISTGSVTLLKDLNSSI